jgi:hypothetical protein
MIQYFILCFSQLPKTINFQFKLIFFVDDIDMMLILLHHIQKLFSKQYE